MVGQIERLVEVQDRILRSFLGMVEAPLFIRPYLAQLTRSELFLVMTGGMASALYAPAMQSVLPSLVAPGELLNAISLRCANIAAHIHYAQIWIL